VAKEYTITTPSMGWKLPFNLAILFHVLLLSSAIIVPKYIHTRTKLPEFTSVNLVNIADLLPPSAANSAPPAPNQTKSVKTIPPKMKTPAKTVPLAEFSQPAPATIPARAISIKPLKRKLKKKVPPGQSTEEIEKKRQALVKQQALEAKSRQLQVEASRQKKIAETEAKIASEALAALKHSLQTEASADNNSSKRRNSRSGRNSSALEAQYFSSIFEHLHQYWALPEIKQWDPQLTAIVVITIARNGQIINHKFEKRSGDRIFDQFVSRTIQDANPLPPIPRALKEQQYTLGLRFKPGKIQ